MAGLWDRLATLQQQSAPPVWALMPPDETIVDLTSLIEVAFGAEPRFVDVVSGTVDVMLSTAPSESTIRDLAHVADSGRRIELIRPASDRSRQWSSYLGDEPVIGPGGRISLRRSRLQQLLSISIRRRSGEPTPADWRPVDLVRDALDQFTAQWHGTIRNATVGYYEAGRGVKQTDMALALLAIVENDEELSEGPWRSVVVEPLTHPRHHKMLVNNMMLYFSAPKTSGSEAPRHRSTGIEDSVADDY